MVAKVQTKKVDVSKGVVETKTKPEVKTETKPEVKAEVKKVVEKVKKSVNASKKELKVNVVVEHLGKQVEQKEMIAAVKKAWTKSGKKVGDMKSVELYVKPEDGAIYYVVNGDSTGKIEF